ncbi:MAG: RMD1 family protein [Acidobacteriota bacterium]
MSNDAEARLGKRCEVRAIHVGERIDVKGLEARLTPQQPIVMEVASSGYAVLLRAGAVVLFGLDQLQQERFLADLAPRISEPYQKHETERAIVRISDADNVEPDAITVRELSFDRLQVIAEILGKSVILGRYELGIADAFAAIEPLAHQMRNAPRRLPWKQRDLVRHIGTAMLVEQALVGRAEVLEKPDVLWDRPSLDRFYARLEDEYEIRERHLALDTKVTVVSRTAQTILDLSQAKRSLYVEYYIVALIVAELLVAIVQLVR